MENGERFPLDFDALSKGDVIERSKIEHIYGVMYDDDPKAYAFNCMRLSRQIEDERSDLVTRISGECIHVMTDEEAESVTWNRTRKAVASIMRNAQRRARVVREDFSEEQRRVAESRDRASTAMALLSRKELRQAERDKRLAQHNADAESQELDD